jgi:hypothetical protein
MSIKAKQLCFKTHVTTKKKKPLTQVKCKLKFKKSPDFKKWKNLINSKQVVDPAGIRM